MSYLKPVWDKTNLTLSAFGIPKVSEDVSMISGMFTFNVPVSVWRELHDDVEQVTMSSATSIDGKLNLASTSTVDEVRRLSSFRHPRYQANRGLIYSSSIFLPNPTAAGRRRFGLFTEESGMFFELTDEGLFGVVRTTVGGNTSDDRRLIDTTGIDLSKGNLFDIQAQWRGVGNYIFSINLQPVLEIEYIGSLSELSMFNPANPISFEATCKEVGTPVVIQCGCVDISSEGGQENGGVYGSVGISNEQGQIGINGTNIPVVVIRSKKTVSGRVNTRDTAALMASGYADQRSVLRVWATRDFTAITENDQAWQDFGDGHLEYIEHDNPDIINPMTFDTTKADIIYTSRVNQDDTYDTSALFEGKADIYLTPGDMFVFTMHRETGGSTNVGCTFEFSEEI